MCSCLIDDKILFKNKYEISNSINNLLKLDNENKLKS